MNMESKIVFLWYKNGKEVARGKYAAINAHPGVTEWLGDNWKPLLDTIQHGVRAVATGSLEQVQECAASAKQLAENTLSGSGKTYSASQSVSVAQSDEYDQIAVHFEA
jgi:hypothetical protein